MDDEAIVSAVVDAAVAVHRALGPGLLESVYAAAMAIELAQRQLAFEREWPVQARYQGKPLGVAFRADLLVEGRVIVELKAVSAIEPVHTAQLLSYLRLAGLRLGLLLNFHAPRMKDGIRRIVHGY